MPAVFPENMFNGEVQLAFELASGTGCQRVEVQDVLDRFAKILPALVREIDGHVAEVEQYSEDRDGVAMPVRGDSVIEAGDTVIIFVSRGRIAQVEKLLSVRLDFF